MIQLLMTLPTSFPQTRLLQQLVSELGDRHRCHVPQKACQIGQTRAAFLAGRRRCCCCRRRTIMLIPTTVAPPARSCLLPLMTNSRSSSERSSSTTTAGSSSHGGSSTSSSSSRIMSKPTLRSVRTLSRISPLVANAAHVHISIVPHSNSVSRLQTKKKRFPNRSTRRICGFWCESL